MTLRFLPISAAIALCAALLSSSANGQANPQSPYGGTTVEDIIARVNDQIITRSDYDRAEADVNQEERQKGATMQETSEAHKDLLRNLIDQQLWLSKGKELGITGETELVKQLDEIRKQYHLETLEDLEKAAKEQGVSYEDFKQNIRNKIITQEVMRQEVGSAIRFTPGEAERYYEQHKQDYTQPESVHLSEILISTGDSSDAAKAAAAKAKADDLEARLHAGGDFSQLAKSFSDGPTAAQGGDLGTYQPGALPKVLEDKTFPLKAGQFTEPILTRQGYIILKVNEHVVGGPRPYKDVQNDVEEAYYMSQMEPAVRTYLNKMRDESFIQIKEGYQDTGATPAELHSTITFGAYTPPAPKKKAKVERTRFRETTHTFRQKSPQPAPAPAVAPVQPAPAAVKTSATSSKMKTEDVASEKPGKKEKIRFGQKPRETLPATAGATTVENAGAVPDQVAAENEPVNPLEPAAPTEKTRFSSRAKEAKKAKPTGPPVDTLAPPAPDAGDVADRSTQSRPLGLNGDTTGKTKKKTETTGEKTRYSDKKKEPQPAGQLPPTFTPAPQEPGAPAPARNTQTPQPQAPTSSPQQ
jgi:peptidyl-prolyl cis-trans isomerase SurA